MAEFYSNNTYALIPTFRVLTLHLYSHAVIRNSFQNSF